MSKFPRPDHTTPNRRQCYCHQPTGLNRKDSHWWYKNTIVELLVFYKTVPPRKYHIKWYCLSHRTFVQAGFLNAINQWGDLWQRRKRVRMTINRILSSCSTLTWSCRFRHCSPLFIIGSNSGNQAPQADNWRRKCFLRRRCLVWADNLDLKRAGTY